MRMKLHYDSIIGDTVIYPIYELDYSILSGLPDYSGYTFNRTLSSSGAKTLYAHYSNSAGNITRFIDANIPKFNGDSGAIFPVFKYDYELGGKYYPTQWDTYVQQSTYPTDWNTSPNYIMYYETASTPTIQCFEPKVIGRADSFQANTTYKDTKRLQCKILYAETGAHFGMYWGGYRSSTTSQYYKMGWVLGRPPYPANYLGEREAYSFTDSGGSTVDYRDMPAYGTTGVITDGIPYTSFFVHFKYNNDDYYGIAIVCYASNSGNNPPLEIWFIGLTSEFWGDSLISGGESGQGTWGNNVNPSVNDGTFNSTSNNVGTSDTNYSTTAIQTRVNNSLSGLFSGLTGVYGIYMLDTASGTDRLFTELTKIYGVLYDTGTDAFLNRYLQSMYNPLSAVIAMHLLPYQFAASAIFGATTTKKLTISGYPVSDKIATKYSVSAPEYNILKPVGKVAFPVVSIPKILGGYADFAPYTQCILHLPFIGAIELKTNAIAHGEITVEYLCDIISGNVTARICCKDNNGNTQYVHSASGNCAYNLPLFTMSQDGAAVGKLLSGAAGIVTGALTGNPVNVATGAAGMVGAAIESSFSPRSTQISGNMGGNNMLMSNLDIWLEIIRPVWVQNMYYQKLNGIPSGMSNCIADCGQDGNSGVAYDGYLQIESIDLDNVPCTEQEKREIETLLKQGVFIRGDEL